MIFNHNLRVAPQVAYDSTALRNFLSREYGYALADITAVRILKRSIDARQRNIVVNLSTEVFVNEQAPEPDFGSFDYKHVENARQVVVVGAGPAGLFAALRLIELGLKPVVLERGKDVATRKRDIAHIYREGVVDPESNYCFGEGGAGAYSDGKLYTRSKKRGDNSRILKIFCQNGANPAILIDAHPHIGTDKLPTVISNMRKRIIEYGGEVRFCTKVTGLIMSGSEVRGVVCQSGEEFLGPVILATGHSARDVYRMLDAQGVQMQAKGIAVGVRLEHPQILIDNIRYHSSKGRGQFLPAAEYSCSTQVKGRGVYSFCMCPGGFVVPAANGPEQGVVNGMSASARSSKWANSGMVVEVRPEDVEGNGLFKLMEFQERMEFASFRAGGGRQQAPAQRMTDYLQGRVSRDLPSSSYVPGLTSTDLGEVLPPFVHERLRAGLAQISANAKGFLTREAQLIGVETRTSSPLRIPRESDSLQHPEIKGLYPCGEGAGFAGGIVSAAVDGERAAEAVASCL